METMGAYHSGENCHTHLIDTCQTRKPPSRMKHLVSIQLRAVQSLHIGPDVGSSCLTGAEAGGKHVT